MNFDLPDDVRALVAVARDFRTQVLAPLEEPFLADGNVPWPLRPRLQQEARERGLWAIDVPREHGGLGLGQLAVCAVHEELNKHPMMFEAGGAPEPVLYHCGPHQWERYFAAVVAGERRSAYAFTEPGTGSDLGAIETRAVRDGDDWVIDGSKLFIGLAERVEFLILFAATDPARGAHGVTVFLIDSGTPGYEIVRTIPTMGDAWEPCELRFEQCRIPDAQRLGEVDAGFATADHQLSHGRLKIASYQLGIAQRCIDEAVAWAQQRTTWGGRSRAARRSSSCSPTAPSSWTRRGCSSTAPRGRPTAATTSAPTPSRRSCTRPRWRSASPTAACRSSAVAATRETRRCRASIARCGCGGSATAPPRSTAG